MASKLKANPQNRVTLMEGTPNERTFYLENPSQLTTSDLSKIKQAYGIPEDTSLEKTKGLLKQLEKKEITSPLKSIPYDQGTAEYAGELYAQSADMMERAELIKDPAQYLTDTAFGDIPYVGKYIPKGMVSEPTASMVGGMLGVTAAQAGQSALGLATVRNPFVPLTPAQLFASESLGSQIGTGAYKFANNVIRSLMDLPEEKLSDQYSQFLYDTALNAMFTGGAMTMAPIFNASKAFIGKNIFGISPSKENLQKISNISETYGMPMGIIQASNMPFWKAYSKVLGILPWVGSAFEKQQQAVGEGARQYLAKMSNGFAPMQTMTMLSGDIQKLMQGNYESVRAAQRYMYENFEEFASKLKGKKVINLDGFKQVAEETAQQYKEAIPGMQGYGEFRFPGDGTQRAFGTFYETMKGLDSNVTFEQAITLRQTFNDFLTNFKTEFKGKIPENQAQAIGNLAARLEYDILNLKNVDNAIDETVYNTALAKLAAANEYFAHTIPTFSGGVASNMKQVNANIFGPGPDVERGLMYKDEIFNIVLGRAKQSKEAMQHLMELSQTTPDQLRAYKKAGNKAGVAVDLEVMVKDMDIESPTYGKTIKKVMPIISQGPNAGKNKILRRLFDDATTASIEGLPAGVTADQFLNIRSVNPEEILESGFMGRKGGVKKAAPDLLEFKDVRFNPQKFAESLGLDTPDGIEVLGEALKGTGVSVKGVTDFIKAVDQARGFVVNDASTFLTRRLTLGGLRSLMVFQGGAALTAGSLNPVLTALTLKYGSSILTDPKALKAFTGVYEDIAKNAVTGKGDMRDVLTLSRRNDILEWAAGVLPTEEQLDQREYESKVDDAIFSLMQTQQTKSEERNARKEQFRMMEGKISDEQNRAVSSIERRLNPRFNMDVSMDSSTFQPQTSPYNPRTRQELAFGTLDEALASEGGIGGL